MRRCSCKNPLGLDWMSLAVGAGLGVVALKVYENSQAAKAPPPVLTNTLTIPAIAPASPTTTTTTT